MDIIHLNEIQLIRNLLCNKIVVFYNCDTIHLELKYNWDVIHRTWEKQWIIFMFLVVKLSRTVF